MRAAVVAAARGWLGTPYRHQASVRGEGADCLGLIRGVWRELLGAEPEAPPPYGPDWAEVGGEETLLAAARRWLAEIPVEAAAVGDVVLFRMAPCAIAKHVGILTAPDRFIHAYDRLGVIEEALTTAWARRIAFAFRFPAANPFLEKT